MDKVKKKNLSVSQSPTELKYVFISMKPQNFLRAYLHVLRNTFLT